MNVCELPYPFLLISIESSVGVIVFYQCNKSKVKFYLTTFNYYFGIYPFKFN